MTRNFWRGTIILLIVLCNIGCDQITKNIARTKVAYHEIINVVSDYLIITKVENKGAFLGLGDELPSIYWNIFMLYLPLIILFGMFFYLLNKTKLHPLTTIALSFIVGGGIGNIIDRYLYHSVTDFLYIDLGIVHTGVFNMADVSVMLGMIVIVIQYLLNMFK